ncbi:hypothetical protein ScPMuIL_000875 [Solemya velum]
MCCMYENEERQLRMFKPNRKLEVIQTKIQDICIVSAARQTIRRVSNSHVYTQFDEALKVYNGFHFDKDTPTVAQITAKFDEFAVRQINVTYERFLFNERQQEGGETFENFYSSVRNLSKTCDFCEQCRDSMIRDKIVFGIRDSNTQTELLKVRDLILIKCVDTCRAAENAILQGKAMNSHDNSEEVHKLRTQPSAETMIKECEFCGKRHKLQKEECSAHGKHVLDAQGGTILDTNRKLYEALSGLPGVVCITDDVIIHGDTAESHDAHYNAFLQRCREQNIKLNKEKLNPRLNVTFMRHQITKDWLQTDPEKVDTIKEYPAPMNVEELRRFLGMVNYLARYLSHFTKDLQPLQNLKKDVHGQWKPLINDVSEYGLGSILMQENRPIAYASRTLTPTIPVADALSRAPVSTEGDTESENLKSLKLSPFAPQCLEEIKKKTSEDCTLSDLKEVILREWSPSRQECPHSVTPYFNYGDELTIQDGIILRGDRVVIPPSMGQEMKEKVHAGHSGINSCLRRAQDLIFWPRMSAEIRQFVEACDVCTSHKEDPYLGLLNLRDTPEEGMTSTPTQRLMGRRTKTALPTTFKLLQPTAGVYIKQEKQLLENKRQVAAEYHCDQKDLKPLTSGDSQDTTHQVDKTMEKRCYHR